MVNPPAPYFPDQEICNGDQILKETVNLDKTSWEGFLRVFWINSFSGYTSLRFHANPAGWISRREGEQTISCLPKSSHPVIVSDGNYPILLRYIMGEEGERWKQKFWYKEFVFPGGLLHITPCQSLIIRASFGPPLVEVLKIPRVYLSG